MHEVVQVLGSVAAILLAFGAGWLWRELQFRRRRATMRRKRKANVRRKTLGQPKLGVTGSRKVRPVAPGFDAEHPWAAPKPVRRMGLTADEWLEDTYREPDSTEAQPEYNEAPADELEVWRGKAKSEPAAAKPGGTVYLPTVTRNPFAAKKLDDHEIMKALLADDEEAGR